MTSPLSPATTGASADGARPVPPLVVLIGPTASGKSSLAIQLARSLDASGHPAEIVNGDSMAIYAGMDIGTAKPSASDRALVPHHLVDVLEVTQTSTVADFQQLAREVIARLRSSGRIPILVGGIVPVRASGHRRLRVPRDRSAGARPVGARAGRPRRCRTVRGAGSSRPPPGQGSDRAREQPAHRACAGGVGTHRPLQSAPAATPLPARQCASIRTGGRSGGDGPPDRGAGARHVRCGVGRRGAPPGGPGTASGVTAARALGYQQVLAMLDGQLDQQGAIRATIDGTRRFARKQLGWFRRDPRIEWLPADGTDLPQRIAARLFAPDGGH